MNCWTVSASKVPSVQHLLRGSRRNLRGVGAAAQQQPSAQSCSLIQETHSGKSSFPSTLLVRCGASTRELCKLNAGRQQTNIVCGLLSSTSTPNKHTRDDVMASLQFKRLPSHSTKEYRTGGRKSLRGDGSTGSHARRRVGGRGRLNVMNSWSFQLPSSLLSCLSSLPDLIPSTNNCLSLSSISLILSSLRNSLCRCYSSSTAAHLPLLAQAPTVLLLALRGDQGGTT